MKRSMFLVAALVAVAVSGQALAAGASYTPPAAAELMRAGGVADMLRQNVPAELTDRVAIEANLFQQLADNEALVPSLQAQCGGSVDGQIGPQTRACVGVIAQAIADARRSGGGGSGAGAGGGSGGAPAGGGGSAQELGRVGLGDPIVAALAARHCPPETDATALRHGDHVDLDCGNGQATVHLRPDFERDCSIDTAGNLVCEVPAAKAWLERQPDVILQREDRGWCSENVGWCGTLIAGGTAAVVVGVVATTIALSKITIVDER